MLSVRFLSFNLPYYHIPTTDLSALLPPHFDTSYFQATLTVSPLYLINPHSTISQYLYISPPHTSQLTTSLSFSVTTTRFLHHIHLNFLTPSPPILFTKPHLTSSISLHLYISPPLHLPLPHLPIFFATLATPPPLLLQYFCAFHLCKTLYNFSNDDQSSVLFILFCYI